MAAEKLSKLLLDAGGTFSLIIPSDITLYLDDITYNVEGSISKYGYNFAVTPQRISYTLKNENYFTLDIMKGTYGDDSRIASITLYDKSGAVIIPSTNLVVQGTELFLGFFADEDLKQAGFMCIGKTPPILVESNGEYYSYGGMRGAGVEVREKIYRWLNGAYSDSTDPYDPGDEPQPPGGDGDPEQPTDPVDIPGLPDIGAVDSGFVTLYNPTQAQLKQLANYMWSDLFSLDTLKKLFSDPMEAIIGLAILPCHIPDGPVKEVTVGNIGTGVNMTTARQQYIEIDCGTVTIPEFWGAYLDYSPYTRLELFLPMIGIHAVSADEVIGKAVKIVYHIDILSGACVAYVKCGSSVLYEFTGQCSTMIPINGSDWSSAISAAVASAAVIGTTVATGGAAAPVAAGAEGAAGVSAGAVIAGGAAVANNVMNAKPHIERSGSMSGSAGIMGNKKPYFVITRPKQCLPANQNKYEGYPSYQTLKLSSCSGFTQVETVHLENISATDEEKNEIMQLLRLGVII